MKPLLCAAMVTVAALTVSAEETKLGAGVTLAEATPIKALVSTPAQFVGKKVRVDGVATAVCEMNGCWLAIAAQDDPKGPSVRVKVEDGVIVIPVSAKGKQVSAEGTLEEISPKDGEAKEAAGEHAKHDANASKKYQLKGTGLVIK